MLRHRERPDRKRYRDDGLSVPWLAPLALDYLAYPHRTPEGVRHRRTPSGAAARPS